MANFTRKYEEKREVTEKIEELFALSNDVAVPLDAYDDYMDILALPRALMGGTRAIRELCIYDTENFYLPAEDEESYTSYQQRKNRSFLLSAYKRTIQKMAGEVFSEPLVVDEDTTNELILDIINNVDLEGNSLSEFAQDVFVWGLADGITHILVDYDKVPIEIIDGKPYYKDEETGKMILVTKKMEQEYGWRPYMVHIKADQIIGWRFTKEKGKKKLTQVRIKETVDVPTGLFSSESAERIRVLEPGLYYVYEKRTDEQGKTVWELTESGETTLDFIPLVSIKFGEILSDMTAVPPLEGLAYLNLTHFQSNSDQRNILHYARLVTAFGKCLGLDDTTKKIILGGNRLVHTENPQGDLKLVEMTSGKSIESGRQDVQDLERLMAMFGLIYMMPRSGNITATQHALDSSENDSALVIWAKLLMAALRKALQHCAYYLELVSDDKDLEDIVGNVSTQCDFKTLIKNEDAKILLEAVKAGIIPAELFFDELKRRNIVISDVDWVDVVLMLEKDKMKKQAEMETFYNIQKNKEGELEDQEE